MFKVECEGCKAPYQVDERRVPQTGLRMRCPQCGTSFVVQKPGDVTDLPAAVGARAPGPIRPAGPPGAPAAAIGPASAPAATVRKPAAGLPAVPSDPDVGFELDLDLPAALGPAPAR